MDDLEQLKEVRAILKDIRDSTRVTASKLDYTFQRLENWNKFQRALKLSKTNMKTYYVNLTTHEGILLDRFEVAISSDVPMEAIDEGWDIEFVDSIDDAIGRRLKFEIERDKERTK